MKKDHLNYVTVENIAKSYGEHLLFEKVSFSIHKDQKIAFVAKNGTGKTSILNILSPVEIFYLQWIYIFSPTKQKTGQGIQK